MPTVARCFVTRQLPGPALDRLSAVHEVTIWQGRLPPTQAELVENAQDAEGLLSLLTDRIDKSLLDQLPKLRVISNYAVGYDNVDLDAATRRGIPVGHTPDVLTDATADLTLALMLAAARSASSCPRRRLGHLGAGQAPGIRGLRRDAGDHRLRPHRARGSRTDARLFDAGIDRERPRRT
jgi:glyoxylate reductase